MKNKSSLSNKELAAKFNEMADKFEKIYNANKTRLKFSATKVCQTVCGTVACHGGFAYLALHEEERTFKDFGTIDVQYLFKDTQTVGFTDGANDLAKFFGFKSHVHLEGWADNHPELWGNKQGDEMFSAHGYVAFGFTFKTQEQCDLLAVANHYRKVAKNLTKWHPWLKFKYWLARP